MFKSDPDFSGKIDPRFYGKNRIAIEKPAPGRAHHRKQEKKVQTNLFNFLRSDRDFSGKIDQRFYRTNRSAIFRFHSRSGSRLKIVPEKSLIDFHVHITIMIAIENFSGKYQGPIFIFCWYEKVS
jgi:hypothetical protein